MSTTFLVGVDGSAGSKRAAEYAAVRAAAEGAELLLLHVVDWSPYEVLTPEELESRPVDREEEIARARSEILQPLLDELTRDGLQLEGLVRHGHAAEMTCEVATDRNVDQVFCGRRGRSRLSALLFGSVSGGLVQACPVPVTVVP